MSQGSNTPFRPAVRRAETRPLFDLGPEWEEHWRGMPAFEPIDAGPRYRITINFLTAADVAAFAERTGLRVTPRSDSAWYPDQRPLSGEWFFDGPKTDSRYPVCIPSKGRADCQRTGKALDRLGVSYRFFVEETEYDAYCAALGESRVVRLPFHDLGQGSVPARNFIWDWARERGYARHWVVDDNIRSFVRCTGGRRLCVYGGGLFRAMEDFVDRYENVALAGPHDKGFVNDRSGTLSPFLLNSRVYSCILVDTALPYRWRGRYNEDTDLSLRCLKDGRPTVLFRSLLMDKMDTVGGRNARPLPGGNTDSVYTDGDYRRRFAEALRELHPDVVQVVWKFNRWHHQVDYSPFRKNRLIPRPGVVLPEADDDYGMTLVCRPRKRRSDQVEAS